MTQPANDNTARPEWYDKLLVDYLPFARKCANRMRGNDDADEIVQDFYVDACNRWAAYDRENYKFGTWVWQLIRNAVYNRRARAKAKKRSAKEYSLDKSIYGSAGDGPDFETGADKDWHDVTGSPPHQIEYAELSAVLAKLSGTRDSDALMRLAMGDELQDVAVDMGISRERVRQLAERERARLRKVVG